MVDLILRIQNEEAGIDLSLQEQPDLLDISASYSQSGGEFWIALEEERVIGTIGLLRLDERCAALKKFFVDAQYRTQGVGRSLYQELLRFAHSRQLRFLILDTPAVATASHRFYERAGFRPVTRTQLPTAFSYPDRDSRLYLLELSQSGGIRPR